MSSSKDFNIVKIIVCLGVPVIVAVMIYYGYFAPQPCDLDKQYLWCHTHPASVLSISATAAICLCAIGLSGIWGLVMKGDLDQDEGKAVVAVSAILGLAGFITMWIA